MPFPTSVYFSPAVAVEGDFCDSNPRSSVNAGPAGLVAGPAGARIGRFCWATAPNDFDGSPASVTNTGTGPVTGFLHREMQALITAYLGENTMIVPAGFPITLMKTGGYWVRNAGSAASVPGQVVYATLADGSAQFAASGATVTGAVATKYFVMSVGAVGELVKISSVPNG